MVLRVSVDVWMALCVGVCLDGFVCECVSGWFAMCMCVDALVCLGVCRWLCVYACLSVGKNIQFC